jgi:hypothetical protein
MTGKRVAIVQSNYIPWKGYFDIIDAVDTFIFLDDVQYTSGDWRNRNRIKTESGPQWLTIPVGKHIHRLTCEVALPAADAWATAHWRKIERAYRAAPFFEHYREYFETLYLSRTWRRLSDLNQTFVQGISRDLLGITTCFERSTDYTLTGTKSARLISLLSRVGAEVYLSGPAARAYIVEDEFAAAGIQIEWKDYAGYPEYPQLHRPFRHDVSILDLLFHTGPDAPRYIWGWRESRRAAA